MRERPAGLREDDDLLRGLADGWGLVARSIEFLPVGAYHWAVDDGAARWFVTVDARADPTLPRALGTATALRQAGLEFVRDRAAPHPPAIAASTGSPCADTALP
ncbi:hypothetical protein [Paractinoplanes maris]|uniref:hypothetical protein n=1 Tax=Paractinoplanes maris TaxID=1734446 RepID=UPI002022045D|nr:hypothetical protein [Actinoplanes maris]